MDLNELLIFTRVVQAGSFTAAARALGMPKSSVSRKVSELEDRVGARLLQRTTRKLGLTDAGRIYFDHSARIVAEVEEADRAVSRLHAAPRGLLRATLPLSFALLGPVIAEYLKRYPEVRVELYCTDRRVDLVEEGFDVAVRAGPLGDSSLIARGLGTIRRVLVAAPAYLRRRGRPRTPADLTRHGCLAFAADGAGGAWELRDGDRVEEVRVAPRLAVNDFELMRTAVLAGLGIAWMPAFLCADDLRAKRLERVLPGWASAEAPLHVVYPTARHLTPKVAAFVALLRKRLDLGARV